MSDTTEWVSGYHAGIRAAVRVMQDQITEWTAHGESLAFASPQDLISNVLARAQGECLRLIDPPREETPSAG